MGRFDKEFVDTIQRPLEKFLNRIASHATLSKNPCFETFLYGNDLMLSQAITKTVPALTTRANSWMESRRTKFEEKVVSKATPLLSLMRENSSSFKKDEERTREDAEFDSIAMQVGEWEGLIAHLSKCFDALLIHDNVATRAHLDFAHALESLGKWETGDLASSLTGLGMASKEISTFKGSSESESMEKLLEPLREYTNSVQCLRRALACREEARLAFVTARATASSLQRELSKVQSFETQPASKLESVGKVLRNRGNLYFNERTTIF